jgi:molybdenum cofactor cytidylyltransferase
MAPRIAGIVLASGMSTRFGTANKLLAPVRGIPVVARTVQAYIDAGVVPLIVVVGHDAREIELALIDLPVRCVSNPEFRLGQSRALVRGIRELPKDIDAAVIGVADQPFLNGTIVQSVVNRYRLDRPLIVAPRYGGRNGNPVLFSRHLFGELLEVEGDQGGRAVLQRHRHAVAWVDFDDERAARDVDTPHDLDAANREVL